MNARTLIHFARCVAASCTLIMLLGAGRTCLGSGHGKAAAAPAHGESAGGHGGHGAEDSGVKGNGIELGQFKIRSDYPAEAQKSTVRFVLYAAIKPEMHDEMDRLVEHHQTKIRDEIITATRLTPLGVFEEPDLTTFRRRIQIRLRRTLPELKVEGLYISDFGLIVKSL
jgi:hypothetical protein